jgi:K+-transporting ATPase ATPase B chain
MKFPFISEEFLLSVYRGFQKLNPLTLYRNPIIFITEIGAILTLLQFLFFQRELQMDYFALHVSFWLWAIVIFSNIAESFAEIRGETTTDYLRRSRSCIFANRYDQDGNLNVVGYRDLKIGDLVLVRKDEVIPADGEIISGAANIDESLFTGEMHSVFRKAMSPSRNVLAGTKVVSQEIVIKVTTSPGEGVLDKMIDLVEGAIRNKTHNELAMTILLSNLCVIFLVMVVTFQFFGIFYNAHLDLTMQIALLASLVPTTVGGLLNAVSIAGINRLMKKNVVAKSGQAIEAAGDVDLILLDKTGTITQGNRLAVKLIPAADVPAEEFARVCYLSSLSDETKEGHSIVELVRTKFPYVCIRPRAKFDFFPFREETRLSGMDIGQESYRKGALDAIEGFLGRTVPDEISRTVRNVAEEGNTPLIVADGNRILGTIVLHDTIKTGLSDQFREFHLLGVRSVMVTGDNPITAAVVASEVKADDFIASANPEQKLHYVRQQQLEGHSVAMTGDGLNDVPALVQADLAIAMNDGAQAAKDAANMIDLDSHPSKLFDIVQIGKELLMTRGALTAFTLGNDISKYFVLLPALLIPVFPGYSEMTFLHLSSPRNTILSGVIFNALMLILLVPLSFTGVKLVPNKINAILKKNLLLYGVGGIILPFLGIKLIDTVISHWFNT